MSKFASLSAADQAKVLELVAKRQGKKSSSSVLGTILGTAGDACVGAGRLADDVVQGAFTVTEKVAGGATDLLENTAATATKVVEDVVCGIGDPLFDALDDAVDSFFNLFSSDKKKGKK